MEWNILILDTLKVICEKWAQKLILSMSATIDRLYVNDVMEEEQVLLDRTGNWSECGFENARLQEWFRKRYTGYTKEWRHNS